MGAPLGSLYICYLSLDDPLVHSQVVAYLDGLAREGHRIHLLTFEPAGSPKRPEELRADLARRGITWHRLRYHKRPSLPATVFDALVGAAKTVRLVRRHRLQVVHARSHVPAAMALIARRFARFKLLFDLRGLMAEEYVDAGNWQEGGLPFRITKRVEGAAIRAADAMVVLTERVRRYLFPEGDGPPVTVIPCCADIDEVAALSDQRATTRAELGVGERPVLLYVGKFTGWYMESEMVGFFAAAREEIPGLVFVIVTQADREPALAALRARGIGADDYRLTQSAPGEIGRFLAAADAGIAFIRPCLSKISSSPTKIGEYLAGGLPVVSGRGIGDVDEQLGGGRVGVLVDAFDDAHHGEAARALRAMIEDATTADRCRGVARDRLSLDSVGIPRYAAVYRALAG